VVRRLLKKPAQLLFLEAEALTDLGQVKSLGQGGKDGGAAWGAVHYPSQASLG
jgi:hypothetical protein